MKWSMAKHLVFLTSAISSALVLAQTSPEPKPTVVAAKPATKAASVNLMRTVAGVIAFQSNCPRP
jgi:hypothetical protein